MDIKINPNKEILFCANVCSLLTNIDTVGEKVADLVEKQDFLTKFTKIRSIDGITSGENAQALIIHCRYPDNMNVHNIYVVFRGSGMFEREKWIMDNRPELMKMMLNGPFQPENIMVHSGLLRMYRSVQMELRRIAKEAPPLTRFIMSGYGTGAALARLAALDIAWNTRLDPYRLDAIVKTITFATPVFANKEFQELSKSICKGGDISIAGAEDPLCHIPVIDTRFRCCDKTRWIKQLTVGSGEVYSINPPIKRSWGIFKLPLDIKDHGIERILIHLRTLV